MDNSYTEMVLGLQIAIGKRLKRLRREKGLSQKDLAARVNGCVDYTYIGKIERGKQLPSLKVLIGISGALLAPVSYFFGEGEETIVYVDTSTQLGYLLKDEKGRELLDILKLLQPQDIPLVMEIIKILARHGNIKEPANLEERSRKALEAIPNVVNPPLLDK